MAKLTTKERKALPKKDFALPGGRFPIENLSHARNALARAAQHASPNEEEAIQRKVHEKYPNIGKGKDHGKMEHHDTGYSHGGIR